MSSIVVIDSKVFMERGGWKFRLRRRPRFTGIPEWIDISDSDDEDYKVSDSVPFTSISPGGCMQVHRKGGGYPGIETRVGMYHMVETMVVGNEIFARKQGGPWVPHARIPPRPSVEVEEENTVGEATDREGDGDGDHLIPRDCKDDGWVGYNAGDQGGRDHGEEAEGEIDPDEQKTNLDWLVEKVSKGSLVLAVNLGDSRGKLSLLSPLGRSGQFEVNVPIVIKTTGCDNKKFADQRVGWGTGCVTQQEVECVTNYEVVWDEFDYLDCVGENNRIVEDNDPKEWGQAEWPSKSCPGLAGEEGKIEIEGRMIGRSRGVEKGYKEKGKEKFGHVNMSLEEKEIIQPCASCEEHDSPGIIQAGRAIRREEEICLMNSEAAIEDLEIEEGEVNPNSRTGWMHQEHLVGSEKERPVREEVGKSQASTSRANQRDPSQWPRSGYWEKVAAMDKLYRQSMALQEDAPTTNLEDKLLELLGKFKHLYSAFMADWTAELDKGKKRVAWIEAFMDKLQQRKRQRGTEDCI